MFGWISYLVKQFLIRLPAFLAMHYQTQPLLIWQIFVIDFCGRHSANPLTLIMAVFLIQTGTNTLTPGKENDEEYYV